jgi:subtilisin family serine protease
MVKICRVYCDTAPDSNHKVYAYLSKLRTMNRRPNHHPYIVFLILLFALIVILPAITSANEYSLPYQNNNSALMQKGGPSDDYRPDTVIVRFRTIPDALNGKQAASPEAITNAHAAVGATVIQIYSPDFLPGLQVVRLPPGKSVQEAIVQYEKDPAVLYAEPDYFVSIDDPLDTGTSGQGNILSAPNDPYFVDGSLWGLHNIGQGGGTPDADIDAPEAWDITTGSPSVIVAVIDTGVDYTHPDIAANIWTNAAGKHGYDFYNNDDDPIDDHSHGTHCAGTIGGVGNNGVGVAGVNWQVKIMALKLFDASGSFGGISNAISCIQYASQNGAHILSISWGGGVYSQALKDAITAFPGPVVCAAGNNASDNDISPFYPASYDCPNIISVMATNKNDQPAAWFTNWGLNSVDIAAPGEDIWSTVPGSSYALDSGTSMATPHVAGVAALVKALHPEYTYWQVKSTIENSADSLPSLSGKSQTGGRLNAYRAVITVTLPAPVASFIAVPTKGVAPLNVQFNDTSTNTPTGWSWFFGDESYMAPWTQMAASAGWSGRESHTSVVMSDGSIVLMGGYGSVHKNDVWRSTNNGATWTQVNASAGWSGRALHSSVVMPDGSIVLMGGVDYTYSKKNDVWKSINNGVTWTLVNASAGWSGRYAHSSVVIPDGSIVLMGGNDGGNKNDVWRSTDNGTIWTQMNASAGWMARPGHTSVAMPDGSIVLMGGGGGGSYKNDAWRSTDKGATWTQMNASAGWSPRDGHSSVVMPDGSIVLMGGYDGSGFNRKNDVWRSTDNGATWIQLTESAGWSGREGLSNVVMPDGSIVVMGGYSYGFNNNDVWRLVPTSSSLQNPSHTYITPGIYSVALQAYNAGGYNSTQKIGYITVNVTSSVITPPSITGLINTTYQPAYITWNWTDPVSSDFDRVMVYLDGVFQSNVTKGTQTFTASSLNLSTEHTISTHTVGTTGLINQTWVNATAWTASGSPTTGTLYFRPETSSVGKDCTTTYDAVFNPASSGLLNFNVTLTLTNATVGEIVGVTWPTWAVSPTNSTIPADAVWFRATDTSGASGTGEITLFNLTVRGDSIGTTGIAFGNILIEDRVGEFYRPLTRDANFTVVNCCCNQFPNPSGGLFPPATDPDNCGKTEDLDGNGWIGFNDVVVYYTNMEDIDIGNYGSVLCYDLDGNGWIGFNDVVTLYQKV